MSPQPYGCAVCGSASGLLLVTPKLPYVFSNLAKSATETVVLASAICVEALRELVLVVRVHSATLGASASLSIRVMPAAPTDWAPEVDFLADEPIATVSLASGIHTPALLRAVTFPPLPTHVEIQLLATQADGLDTFLAELSIDLTGHA